MANKNLKSALLCITSVLISATLLTSCSPASKVDSQTNNSTSEASRFKRHVAVTIDDLPSVGARSQSQKNNITELLIKKLVAKNVPAIGFVNEKKLGKSGPKPHNIALLQAWVDAGLELGNHTYSHAKFFNTSLEDFQQEVLRGEQVTKTIFTPKAGDVRYFRHPFLNTGPDMQTRIAFEQFLSAHNYKIAPVTLDNDEWVYSKAYNIASKSGDEELKKRIGKDYIRYMLSTFNFYETLSQDLFNKNIAHIFLIHANQINADYLDQLLNAISERGYQFVSLQDALKDPAYQHQDNYIGKSGLSWLQRWWINEGNTEREEPEPSQWVNNIAFKKNQTATN